MDVFELVAKLTLDSSAYDSGLSESEGKATSFASKFGGALGTAGKVGAAAFGAVTTAGVAAVGAVIKGTASVAEYGDNIDKMSQKMGISSTAYQEWDAIMQHSGTSMETLKSGMKTLANAVENGNEAFERIGITQEQIASMNQEDLFAATIAGLQNVENETERTYLAGQLLGRGATELGALLNTSAEDTEAMRQRVHELGGVMSEEAVKAAAKYQDSMQDMKTAMTGLSRGMLSEFLPSVTGVIDGLTEIFGGDSAKGAQLISEGIAGIAESITAAIPNLISTGAEIVSSLVNVFLENLPQIVQMGTDIIVQLVEGLVAGIPVLLEKAPSILSQFGSAIMAAAPRLLEAALSLMDVIAKGITTYLPIVLQKAPEIIMTIISGIVSAAPRLLAKMGEIMMAVITAVTQVNWIGLGMTVIQTILRGIISLVTSIPSALLDIANTALGAFQNIDWYNLGSTVINFILNGIVALTQKIPNKLKEIGQDAVKAFKEIDWLSLGSAVIEGIASGIRNGAGAIIGAAKDAASGALSAAKNFLGINSPSRVFREEVGRRIPEGLAEGIDKYSGLVDASIDKLASATLDPFGGYEYDVAGAGRSVSIGTININVDGSDKDVNEIAEAIADIFQKMVNNEEAAYGYA